MPRIIFSFAVEHSVSMQVIRGLCNVRDEHHGCVATIGNFDGVHLGHRAVFKRLIGKGIELGSPATVITFEPQAMEYFTPAAAPARLTRLREKLAAVAECEIERVVLLRFGPKLAQLAAQEFVRKLLVEALGVRHLLVGDDFRFGHGRQGDFKLLEQMGLEHGFAVEDLSTVTHAGERVSSTRIREALVRGDFDLARHLLGRPYRICGRVGHGDKRGRSIGYPTANLNLHRRVSPLRGVYAVMIRGAAAMPLPGVANVGMRPTIHDETKHPQNIYLLEVHLFDFGGDLYGQHLEVEFRLKLRDEQKFGSFAELKAQIDRDVRAAREYLNRQ